VARINNILEKLNDHAPTTVDLPGKSEGLLRCRALLVKLEPPGLELVFPPHSWVADDLAFGADCNLAVEHNGSTVNLIARLDEVVQPRRLRFTAREPIAPESLREFFRVPINLPIEVSYIAGPKETKTETWKMIGTTLDLSGSGVLALFADKPASNHRIQMIISIPNEKTPVACLANVIRSYRIRKNRFQVAFHFENISPKSRDMLISCCLQEQRRQLRENVQTL
jgi:c-di-GMP-binding flagellar brake protein YcgR